MEPTGETEKPRESLGSWLGINRATLAVLAVIGGLGLAEEIWRNFLAVYLADTAGSLRQAVGYMGLFAFGVNLLEGFGYMLGGTLAHRMGARAALAVSALPMALGFGLLLTSAQPLVIVAGALLISNWEPLSVPAAFDVVGGGVPRNRRTVAFAVQSIQKRLPKVLGPLTGGFVFAAVGYWGNLALAFGILAGAVLLQAALLPRLQARPDPVRQPLAAVLGRIPDDLRQLLNAEILLRWGDWFVRDFAVLYVVEVLRRGPPEAGFLVALSSFTALLTYVPMGKLIDRFADPRPFIGLTFLLFALFPFLLVLLPRSGLPVPAALMIAFTVNGLRELGEPARKALITTGLPADIRAQAVGLYWGLRSFAFCPAPLAAWWLWQRIGPDHTFLVGGTLGLLGTAWFWLRAVPARPEGDSR